jgi:hypothetical protein
MGLGAPARPVRHHQMTVDLAGNVLVAGIGPTDLKKYLRK